MQSFTFLTKKSYNWKQKNPTDFEYRENLKLQIEKNEIIKGS